ncbi:MAG: ROK family protein [Clostridia bacterium]|nr:ROK family protein [Clostridia bacterium]
MERINLSSIKKESVRAIFTAITAKDQISRAEIAEITGLSLMTVGKVVDALLERSVISQCKEVRNMAGRRAGLVSLNTAKFFMILDLTSRSMSMTVMDLALNIVDRVTYEYNHDFYYEENLYIFMKNVKIYILRKLNMDDAVGIGVVLPGNYNAESDTVDAPRIPELSKTHVRAIIEDVLRTPVTTLEKDVVTAAASNLADLTAENISNAVYVCIGETLSGALISGGQLLHGKSGYAGDIGRFPTEHARGMNADYRNNGNASGAKTLQALFDERGLREETVSALAEAIAYEILLLSPDVVVIENCCGVIMETFRPLLTEKLSRITQTDTADLPQIRILESGVRHAYRGLALGMRSAWIQNESK